MITTPLEPFGLRVDLRPGSTWDDFDITQVHRWVAEHRVLVIRGLAPLAPEALAAASRKLGPLQPWSFGAVHELKRARNPDNYLYTEHAVPLHWDGAFADAVPHYLVFRCVAAPPSEAGGETVFVDTIAVLERASAEQRARWAQSRVRYDTEKKAHYGGSFTADVIGRHPTLEVAVIRYAEPVDDLNPVSVEPLGLDEAESAALMRELRQALYDPAVLLAIPWLDEDVVVADNHALLHGRHAFRVDAPRHLLRVNVLDDTRRWWWSIRDSWRVRRPEYMRAEIPILGIPAALCASSVRDLASPLFIEAMLLFFLLFNVGDLVNCLLDRDVDLHRKTHLAEAVRALGTTNIKAQIAVSAVIAAGLGVHLALSLHRPWLAPTVIVGAVLGAGYTAPPLRFKTRGLLQLAAYIGLLFVGPMVLVSGLFLPWPSVTVIIAGFAFGAMQTGTLLVNTAEDLDEDEREGIRTVAVALQAAKTMQLAWVLTVVGGASYIALAGATIVGAASGTAWLLAALLPLAIILGWNERWLRALVSATRNASETLARERIRDQGKYVPRHIEAAAWASLGAAVAVLLAK